MIGPKEITILHLSDLHFSANAKPDNLSSPEYAIKVLANELKEKKLLIPHIVVVTGDIVHKGNTYYGFERAANSLTQFMDDIELDRKSFYFVPGNHDIDCTNKMIRGKKKERFHNYIKFVNNFKNEIENSEIIRLDPAIPSADEMNISVFQKTSLEEIDFLLLNSVWNYNYKDEKLKKGIEISIDPTEIEYFLDKRNEITERKSIKIALLHNSPLELVSHLKSDLKTVRNSGQLSEIFDSCSVSLVLHGDIHRSQHAAASRRLGCWPSYILGAGRISPEVTGDPLIHILNFKFWEELGSIELEVLSYHIDGDKLSSQGNKTYNLYLPIKKGITSMATLHNFELPQPYRNTYERNDNNNITSSVMGKNLLFVFRSETFNFLRKKTEELLNNGLTDFPPDRMYSLFYSSMFKCGNEGNIFRAIHDSDWKIWLKDKSSFDIIDDHHTAAIERGINIERIIIIKKEDIEKIKLYREKYGITSSIDDFRELSERFAEKWVEDGTNGGCFKTFFVKEENIEFYKKAKKIISGYEKESIIRRISPGNISLFSSATDISEIKNDNSLIFFYENINDDLYNANLSILNFVIIATKQFIDFLWSEDKIEAKSLITLAEVNKFFGI